MRWSNPLFAVAILIAVSGCRIFAQGTSALERAYDHFSGIWVGTTHDFTESPTITANIRIEIETDKKHKHIHLRYTYMQAGKPNDRYERVFTFDPQNSTLLMDRKQYGGKVRYQVEGLDTFFQVGYGDFMLHGSANTPLDHYGLYRAYYHLQPDTLSYEVFTSSKGAAFVKTSDWSLTREVLPAKAVQP